MLRISDFARSGVCCNYFIPLTLPSIATFKNRPCLFIITAHTFFKYALLFTIINRGPCKIPVRLLL